MKPKHIAILFGQRKCESLPRAAKMLLDLELSFADYRVLWNERRQREREGHRNFMDVTEQIVETYTAGMLHNQSTENFRSLESSRSSYDSAPLLSP